MLIVNRQLVIFIGNQSCLESVPPAVEHNNDDGDEDDDDNDDQ